MLRIKRLHKSISSRHKRWFSKRKVLTKLLRITRLTLTVTLDSRQLAVDAKP